MTDTPLAQMTAELARRFAAGESLGASIKFDFGAEGIIHVDGAAIPPVVGNDDRQADCTIRIAMSDFRQLLDGELDATTAFLLGKLKVEGAMGVALKLQSAMG